MEGKGASTGGENNTEQNDSTDEHKEEGSLWSTHEMSHNVNPLQIVTRRRRRGSLRWLQIDFQGNHFQRCGKHSATPRL